jgi:hypothetical protein
MPQLPDHFQSEIALCRLISNWGLWRDTCNWPRLRECYVPQAQVKTTWMSGTAEAFIEASIQSSLNPDAAVSLHNMGASTVQISGERALVETRVTLMVRTLVHDVAVDITALVRFLDRCVFTSAQWRIARRDPIHERDRMDAVIPGAVLTLEAHRLASLPQGCQHLAYAQSLRGAQITQDLVQHLSPEQAALYEEALGWLNSRS